MGNGSRQKTHPCVAGWLAACLWGPNMMDDGHDAIIGEGIHGPCASIPPILQEDGLALCFFLSRRQAYYHELAPALWLDVTLLARVVGRTGVKGGWECGAISAWTAALGREEGELRARRQSQVRTSKTRLPGLIRRISWRGGSGGNRKRRNGGCQIEPRVNLARGFRSCRATPGLKRLFSTSGMGCPSSRKVKSTCQLPRPGQPAGGAWDGARVTRGATQIVALFGQGLALHGCRGPANKCRGRKTWP